MSMRLRVRESEILYIGNDWNRRQPKEKMSRSFVLRIFLCQRCRLIRTCTYPNRSSVGANPPTMTGNRGLNFTENSQGTLSSTIRAYVPARYPSARARESGSRDSSSARLISACFFSWAFCASYHSSSPNCSSPFPSPSWRELSLALAKPSRSSSSKRSRSSSFFEGLITEISYRAKLLCSKTP